MTCPYFSSAFSRQSSQSLTGSEDGYRSIRSEDDLTYSSYLQLDKVLQSQKLTSGSSGGVSAHDEHLFIITHQAFELWFKQVLYEINSIRNVFMSEYLEERNSLCVISRLNRVVAILKLCTNQFEILETMTSQDFLDFRDGLAGASGFQSFQFRMLEIRLGVVNELRLKYNKAHFVEVFFGDERKTLERALTEPSLLNLVNEWLARTPGLNSHTFDFWRKFKVSVCAMLEEMRSTAEEETDIQTRKLKMRDYENRARSFQSIFDENIHNERHKKSERRFSHQALQGALMIFCYRDEPRFHLPFQVLQSLMDIDSQLMKFRYSHASMVQRMIGSKTGTAGSSGYHYLRSTCSERYKIFLDLFNMATYLVPRDRIPPLTSLMKRSLSLLDTAAFDIPPYLEKEKDSGCQTNSDISLPQGIEEREESVSGNRAQKLETVV